MKIKDGDILTIFGEKFIVNQKEIGGSPEFLDRRVKDKIKKQFLIKSKEIMRTMPETLRPKKVSVKDTTTRWGSCSASGNISLCWRLAFAPLEIMHYVIIHECCHLEQMNHGPNFWALVLKYYGNFKSAKKWLNDHGHTLN